MAWFHHGIAGPWVRMGFDSGRAHDLALHRFEEERRRREEEARMFEEQRRRQEEATRRMREAQNNLLQNSFIKPYDPFNRY